MCQTLAPALTPAVQLLHKLSIRSADGPEKLLRVIKNPITDHLPPNCRKIGTWHRLHRPYGMWAWYPGITRARVASVGVCWPQGSRTRQRRWCASQSMSRRCPRTSPWSTSWAGWRTDPLTYAACARVPTKQAHTEASLGSPHVVWKCSQGPWPSCACRECACVRRARMTHVRLILYCL
jgi:hypothetical protein